mgnify:CR=1 FL=1
MPTTIEEEREYEDKKNIILSILFLLGLFLTVSFCIYCIIKKDECEKEDERIRYKRTNNQIHSEPV